MYFQAVYLNFQEIFILLSSRLKTQGKQSKCKNHLKLGWLTLSVTIKKKQTGFKNEQKNCLIFEDS